MKVKLKTIYAGPFRVAQPGDVIEVQIDEAKALLDGGFADTASATDIETATAEPAETAVSRRKK